MIRKKILRAGILIDWTNACLMSGVKSRSVPEGRYIRGVFYEIQRNCAKLLSDLDGVSRYSCYSKIYHGWHTERNPTPIRNSFEKILIDRNFQIDYGRRFGRVLFLPDITFSDKIYGDTAYGPLYNTLRAQGQKMVDTALVCDTLAMHKDKYADIIIIVSDDDDFVPLLIASDFWGFQTLLLRNQGRDLTGVCDFNPRNKIHYWAAQNEY